MLKNSHHPDNFTVFEEDDQKLEEIVGKTTFAENFCQTEDSTSTNSDMQTDDTIPPSSENLLSNEKELINYWKKVLSGKEDQIERLRRLNDEYDRDIATAVALLRNKREEYSKLYAKTEAELEAEEDDEEDADRSPFEDDDDEKDDSIVVIMS